MYTANKKNRILLYKKSLSISLEKPLKLFGDQQIIYDYHITYQSLITFIYGYFDLEDDILMTIY